MENFSQGDAVALIKAALESKAIELRGTARGAQITDDGAKAAAKSDGAYLTALLTALTGKQP